MGNLRFRRYMQKFEAAIFEGVKKGQLGVLAPINVREGRFSYTNFARFIGNHLNYSIPFVLDYYGHQKRSRGFTELCQTKVEQIRNRQLKNIQTTVVHFSALKIEDMEKITTSPYLKSGFAEFKNIILEKRGYSRERRK
jgi:hypothetical protein